MAQKALKTLAKRNAQTLNRTHAIAAGIHSLFLLLRVGLFRGSFTRGSLAAYMLLSLPAAVIELLVFERGSRPSYTPGSGTGTGAGTGDDAQALRRAGDDLDARGLTEYLWDVLYWTWGCTALAAVAGDKAWWAYAAIPAYSVYLVYTTWAGYRSGGGLLGGSHAEGAQAAAQAGSSKRSQKMEKRGGQKVAYR